MKIRKDVMRLTYPVLMEHCFVVLMGMINTMMASNLSREAVAGIGMVDSINNIFIAVFSSLAVGGTVIVAHYSGRRNSKEANNAAVQALASTTIMAIIITAVLLVFRKNILGLLFGSADEITFNNAYSYFSVILYSYPLISILLSACGVLRGAGDMKTPMKVTIGMNVVNVILSYVFIYGLDMNTPHFKIFVPGMGVQGAALGLTSARVFGVVVILYSLIKGSRIIRPKKLKEFKFNMELLKSIYNVGIPAGLESLLFNVGKLITQIFIVSMGTVAIAANTIGGSVVGILNVPGTALSIAATTIVGQNMGRGRSDEAKSSLIYLTKLSALCLTVLGVISIPVARPILSLYTNQAETIEMAVRLLWLNALFLPLWSVSFILPAGLRGAGDAKYTLMISMAGMWLFRISFGYVLAIPLKLGVAGIWLGMYTDWMVRGVLYWLRLQSGKWNKNIVIKDSGIAK
jgi:putative MATE family efflux protein